MSDDEALALVAALFVAAPVLGAAIAAARHYLTHRKDTRQ